MASLAATHRLSAASDASSSYQRFASVCAVLAGIVTLVYSVAFVLLAIYIAVQSAVTLGSHSHPGHSTLGIVWLAATVLAMFGLAAGKRDTGKRLGNPVLQAESRVTVIDGALAAAVLAGVVLNAALGWWWADPLSALVILIYGLREARHAWTEAS